MSNEKLLSGEELFDEIIVYMSAWRRLRHSFIKEGEERPEFKEISENMVKLMDSCYQEALADLKKQKSSMEKQLKKMHKNSGYGRMYQ